MTATSQQIVDFGEKRSDEALDYTFDFNHADGSTLESGETITSAIASVPDALTLSSAGVASTFYANSSTQFGFWARGGVSGTVYTIPCTIFTSAGRTHQRLGRLKVIDKTPST